jgi:phosphoribosylformylglycinamidine (FGAM) synthase PurS component
VRDSASVAKETLGRLRRRAGVREGVGLEDLVQRKSELQAALLADPALDHFRQLAAGRPHQDTLTCVADPSALDLELVRLFVGDVTEVKDAEQTLTMKEKFMTLEVELKEKSAVLDAALKDATDTLNAEVKDIRDTKMAALETELQDKLTALETEVKDMRDTKMAALETAVKGLTGQWTLESCNK